MIDPALRDREELLSGSLTVSDARRTSRRFIASTRRGRVTLFQPLKDEPWGARDSGSSAISTATFCCSPDRGMCSPPCPASGRRLARISGLPRPSCANNSGTGSRWHPWASAGGRLLRCTSNHRTGCSRIPRRNRNRRGGEARGFLTDYSWTGPFSACGINAAQSGNAIHPLSQIIFSRSPKGSPTSPPPLTCAPYSEACCTTPRPQRDRAGAGPCFRIAPRQDR